MIKPWISERVTELLGFEDDIVINMVISHLEQQDINHPLCPRKMQINLTGFLERNAAVFMKELWNLLITAQDSHAGIVYNYIYIYIYLYIYILASNIHREAKVRDGSEEGANGEE